MKQSKSRIWFDLSISLTYPSILGAIIYFFFNATIQMSIMPVINRIANRLDPNIPTETLSASHFFVSFGLSDIFGFIAFLVITLLIIIHHSIDYLYSKYTEANYGFF